MWLLTYQEQQLPSIQHQYDQVGSYQLKQIFLQWNLLSIFQNETEIVFLVLDNPQFSHNHTLFIQYRSVRRCVIIPVILTLKSSNQACSFSFSSFSISAQFFDAFTANKRFFTGSKGGSGGLLGGLGGLGGGGGGGSGYGAPQKPSYGAPAQRPSYGTPQPKPSYGAQKPSYGAPGGGLNFKQIELPVPDINLPDPIEFKAGVLRSKGRIASGLLHAKAGILRAGANILAQKANALDKVAQAIPAVKAGLINTLKGFGGDKGGGGGYGAPQSGYGTPQQQSRPQYNQPQSYNAPSTGYGNPQGPPVLGQQNFNTQSVNVIPVNNLQNNLNNFNNQQQQQQNYNNQQQQNFNNQNRPNNNLFFGNNNNGNSAPDSYGSPVANPIG